MKIIVIHVGVLVFSFLENKHNDKKEKKNFKLQSCHYDLGVR